MLVDGTCFYVFVYCVPAQPRPGAMASSGSVRAKPLLLGDARTAPAGGGLGARVVCVLGADLPFLPPPGHANATFCPHGYGCRILVVCEGQAILDVTDSELTVTVRVPEGRWFWLVSREAGVPGVDTLNLLRDQPSPHLSHHHGVSLPATPSPCQVPGAAASGDLQVHHVRLQRGSKSQDDALGPCWSEWSSWRRWGLEG